MTNPCKAIRRPWVSAGLYSAVVVRATAVQPWETVWFQLRIPVSVAARRIEQGIKRDTWKNETLR